GAVRDHAVQAAVEPAGGHDDHFLLAFGEARLAQQQRVVIGEEGAELLRAVREGQEHVGHEAGLLLHGQDLLAHVFGQGFQRGRGEAADRCGVLLAHDDSRGLWMARSDQAWNCSACSRANSPPSLSNCSCVPCSTTRPWSSTTTRSADSTVDRRWAMTMDVRPFISVSSADCTSRSLSLSSAEVASSSRSTGAFL